MPPAFVAAPRRLKRRGTLCSTARARPTCARRPASRPGLPPRPRAAGAPSRALRSSGRLPLLSTCVHALQTKHKPVRPEPSRPHYAPHEPVEAPSVSNCNLPVFFGHQGSRPRAAPALTISPRPRPACASALRPPAPARLERLQQLPIGGGRMARGLHMHSLVTFSQLALKTHTIAISGIAPGLLIFFGLGSGDAFKCKEEAHAPGSAAGNAAAAGRYACAARDRRVTPVTGLTRAALCAAVGAWLAVHRSNLSRAWQYACTLPITPHAGAGAAPLPALQTRVFNGSLAGGTMLARVYAQLPEKKPCGNHGFPGQDCTPHYSTSEYGSSEQSHAAWTHGLLSCSCLVPSSA